MSDWVVGIDEAGCGAWAGPVVACAVVAPSGWVLPGLKDSKALSKKKHAELFAQILTSGVARFAIASRSSEYIDEHGIGDATADCWLSAYANFLQEFEASRVILDGNRKPPGFVSESWETIPKADASVPCVSAASICAKYLRDQMMAGFDTLYPQYGFSKHVGYGTKAHQAALAEHGACPIHRRSYRPVQLAAPEASKEFGFHEVSEAVYAAWRK